MDELEKDSRVASLYQAWGKWNDEILLTYQKKTPPLPPLSKQLQFKSIKNMVIAEALKLGSHHVTFEDEEITEPSGLPDGMPTPQAVSWLMKAAEGGNAGAQYALGKLYLSGDCVPKDVWKAVRWLHVAIEQNHSFATYMLGKLYLEGEDIPKDIEKAIQLLTKSAEQENQYAQYALGKLYLCGHDVSRDKEKAVPLLTASAAQGNIYAQFLLDHLDSFRDPSVFLAATRLMHRLENLFRENYGKQAGASPFHIDRKRCRRLAEKKQAQGHKRDDQEPVQSYTYR